MNNNMGLTQPVFSVMQLLQMSDPLGVLTVESTAKDALIKSAKPLSPCDFHRQKLTKAGKKRLSPDL